MAHPYRAQPDKAFWKKTVSPHQPHEVGNWYEKRFEIGDRKVATAGSCFAQHIGRNLREKSFNYYDAEPAPGILSDAMRHDFGYDMYSAR